MKSRVIICSGLGFVVGALGVLAVLIANPFVEPAKLVPAITATDAANHAVETFHIVMPADVVAVTHNGRNIINPRPVGIALFDESALQSGLLLVAKIRNEKGEAVGFGVESETVDASSNPLLGRMRMHTDWTIVLPARGTIYVAQIEDAGSIGMEILPTVMLGKEWNGRADFVSTVGPDPSGRGVIVGGTREFEGITGSFVELSHLTHMSRARGGIGSVELQLAYDIPTR